MRIDLKGLGYYDLTSHMKVADQYASTDYAKDLAWLIKDKQAAPGKFVDEISDAPFRNAMTIKVAGPNDHENVVSVNFDQNDDGNARANVNVIGVGAANASVGKDGVHIGGGITFVGSGNVSISEKGVGVSFTDGGVGPLGSGASVFVGEGKAHLDANLGPISISLGSNGGGITIAGEPVHLGEEHVVQAAKDLAKDAEKVAEKASVEAAKQEQALRDAAAKAEKQARELAEQLAKAAADAAKRAAEQVKAAAEAKARQAAEAAKKAAEDTRKAAEQARAQAQANAKKVADALAAAAARIRPPKFRRPW